MSKLQELILYIARRSEDDRRFGANKLNKLLFYSDFLAYAKTGRSITGATYERLEHGPAPRGLTATLEELKPACAEAERDYLGRKQRRIMALREPDLSEFTGAEVALVDELVDRLRNHGEEVVGELADRFVGWQVAEVGEEIPYGTAFVGPPRRLTREEVEYAQQVVREIGCLATETS
jgi:hypothetical protein